MNTKDFYYDLPEELIAQTPLQQRDGSRLMVLNRQDNSVEHKHFYDIIDMINPGDVLVFNNTRVLPARIFGKKKDTGAAIELLLLKRINIDTWEVMSRPAKRLKEGTVVTFGENLEATVIKILDEGLRHVKFKYDGVFEEVLDKIGVMPLPPYIKATLEDRERYQTVYSKIVGSAAAPTAGLHFTEELLEKLKNKGVQIEFITLHVGLGTFLPVKVENVESHVMHSEHYEIDEETANRINKAKKEGRNIICVGTTSVRCLEAASEDGQIKKLSDDTRIFIYPGYKFNIVDKLITNFHLPESTLIMLVSALYDKEHILGAYKKAVEEKYRFFSFGDAMFIK